MCCEKETTVRCSLRIHNQRQSAVERNFINIYLFYLYIYVSMNGSINIIHDIYVYKQINKSQHITTSQIY
jgi:murein L,D-transpeptidase YcbB/YkuD